MKTYKKVLALFLITLLLSSCKSKNDLEFSGENALNLAMQQVEFGPRPPGSSSHQNTISFIEETLSGNNWETTIQSEEINGYLIQNIIAKRNNQVENPWVILAAHYDTRFFADNDPDENKRLQPVIGANDGASGVAILLELSRVIPDNINKNIWLVFFDAEDQGNIENWDWILGSTSFVKTLPAKPDAVVLLDMVGDRDLNLYFEHNSDPELQKVIWDLAGSLGYQDQFIPQYKYSILDDHIPFLQNGIRAIDIIDFDYPYWHTSEDTIDKISSESLEIVGRTIYHWLMLPDINGKN